MNAEAHAVAAASATRAMTVADLDAVLAIEASAYSHPWTRGNFVDSLASQHWTMLSHDTQGRLRAYLVAMPAVDELHLLNLTVALPWQGQGLARQLLAALCRRAAGMSQLVLEVRRSNQRACHLYRQAGFTEVGVRKAYYPAHDGREDALVMVLPLGQGDAVQHDGGHHGLD